MKSVFFLISLSSVFVNLTFQKTVVLAKQRSSQVHVSPTALFVHYKSIARSDRTTPTRTGTRTRTSRAINPAFQFKKKSSPKANSVKMSEQLDTRSGEEKNSNNKSKSKGNKEDFQSHASAYNSFASAAVDISQARIHTTNTNGSSNNHILTFVRSARDIDDNVRRRFLHQVVLTENEDVDMGGNLSHHPTSIQVLSLPTTQVSSNIQARIPSPSGQNIAIFTKQKNGSGSDNQQKQVVEIWKEGGTSLHRKIILPSSLHGDICTDTAWFGSIQWNADETALVYSAEMKPPSSKSFFDEKTAGGGEEDLIQYGATNTLGYGKGETWGEKYTTTSRLKIYILQVETGNVGEVKNVPGREEVDGRDADTLGGYNLGQATFSPDGKFVVYTAWDAGSGGNMPKRLGSIYCYQRHCAIYKSPIQELMKSVSSVTNAAETEDEGGHVGKDGSHTCLTPNDRLARSPRFVVATDFIKLVWLSNTEGFDTHGGCMGLSSLDWDEDIGAKIDTRTSIVDIVHIPEDDESFPGLFVNQLPSENFVSKDGTHLLLTSQWRSISKVIKICIATGEVQPIAFNLKDTSHTAGSQSLLCMTSSGGAIVSQSEPNTVPTLGYISSNSLTKAVSEDNCLVPSTLIAQFGPVAATTTFPPNDVLQQGGEKKISYHVIRSHPEHGEVKAPVEGILLLPPKSNDKHVPLIVVPHGGPHSCTPTAYVPSYAFLCHTGNFGILHVNFRGSTGFGQAALESLAGTIGDQDVKDVVHLTNQVLAEYEDHIDASRVGVCGGSHGGFLAGHLIGQHPELFKVAALRNPVTNIATMTTATDIPDWTYVESLGPGKYDWSQFRGPNKSDLSAMWDASPIAHANHVTAPTLLAIGNSDKRVPPSQGIEYYHALRSKGVNTKLLLYDDDDHAIDKVQSEADHWINIFQWFHEHFDANN